MSWFSQKITASNWFSDYASVNSWFSEYLELEAEVPTPTVQTDLLFQFYRGYVPDNLDDPVYTAPELNILNGIILNNKDITNTVDLYIVPQSQTLSEKHKIFSKMLTDIKGYDYSWQKGVVLKEGDNLYINCTNPNSLSVVLTGASGNLLRL